MALLAAVDAATAAGLGGVGVLIVATHTFNSSGDPHDTRLHIY